MTDQEVPSHVSIRGCLDVVSTLPTATQYDGEVQEMPPRLPPDGEGPGVMDQTVPFQVSMSTWEPLASKYPPTAAQNIGDAHDTCSRLTARAEMLGLGVMDQDVPSQVSIRV